MGELFTSPVGQGSKGALLLHGFLGQGRNLRTLAFRWEEMDPTRSILLMDLPGHGDSRPLKEDETLFSMAASAISSAKDAGLAPPYDWVGHSQGGRVALAALAVDPSSVRTLTLLDISPSPVPATVSESADVLLALRRAPDSAKDRPTMRAALIEQGLSPALADWQLLNLRTTGDGVAWKIDREALFRFHLRAGREDLWPAVEQHRVPLFCVAGERSPYVSFEDAERLRSLGAQVEVVPSGHYVHVDALNEVLGLLRRLP